MKPIDHTYLWVVLVGLGGFCGGGGVWAVSVGDPLLITVGLGFFFMALYEIIWGLDAKIRSYKS
jgi:hypothetical protein